MQKDPNKRIKRDLLKFTHQKESNNIKLLLESYPREIKGSIFEWYLAELYRGNGWLTKIGGRRGDSGADILLYHPKTPSKVSLIVQAKNHAIPLTFDQTKIELGVALLRRPSLTVSGSLYCFIPDKLSYLITFR